MRPELTIYSEPLIQSTAPFFVLTWWCTLNSYQKTSFVLNFNAILLLIIFGFYLFQNSVSENNMNKKYNYIHKYGK